MTEKLFPNTSILRVRPEFATNAIRGRCAGLRCGRATLRPVRRTMGELFGTNEAKRFLADCNGTARIPIGIMAIFLSDRSSSCALPHCHFETCLIRSATQTLLYLFDRFGRRPGKLKRRTFRQALSDDVRIFMVIFKRKIVSLELADAPGDWPKVNACKCKK